MDVRTLLRRSAGHHRRYEAVVHRGRRLTFEEAWNRGVRLANLLLDLGLRPGDRVGVLEDNSVEAVDFFVGTAAANLVRVPLYARNAPAGHAHMLRNTGCRAVVVSEQYAPDVAPLVDSLPELEHVVVRDGTYEKRLAAQSDVDPDVPVRPDDYYVIRHSGGTTGLPKGIAYTHRSWLATGRDWFYNFPPVQVGDRCLHCGPISHGSGYFFTPMWLSGGSNVLLDHFDAGETLDLMERERIAFMFVVPTMLNAIARHDSARDRDWSHLKVIQVGGAPIADDTALAARDAFGMVLYQGYGQTEALPATMMGPYEWFSEVAGSVPLRSAGRPLPFAGLEIRGPDNKPLGAGEEGEIAVCCDGQMDGFWEDPEGTEQRLVDGWVLTGDIGTMDDNGYLYVLDRKDDMIISGGFNIWPAELENAILEHPGIVEVAVVGIPDERWGETPLALCVRAPGATVTADEVVTVCRERLGGYKKPSRVEFVDALPRTPVGKISRKDLRKPFWEGRDRRVGAT